jgi:hypothetical protein
VQTLDCGEEAATWFSQYILGKDTGARLGYYMQENPTFRRDISKVKLTAFQQHYKKLHDHDVVSCPQRYVEVIRVLYPKHGRSKFPKILAPNYMVSQIR